MSTPRVQAVQVSARILYEDGTFANVRSELVEVARDEIDPKVLTPDSVVVEQLRLCWESVDGAVGDAKSAGIYEQAKHDANNRRGDARRRAAAAREAHRQQAARHDVGRPRPPGPLRRRLDGGHTDGQDE